MKKSKVKVLLKKFKCGRPSNEYSLKVATTRAELHKIQRKSIQVVAEVIGLEDYLIRNVAGLRNFQCNGCLRKIKTLCRHALFEFLSGLNWIQRSTQQNADGGEGIVELRRSARRQKYVFGGFITGKKKSSTKNR